MEDRVRGKVRNFIGWRSSIRGEGFFGSKSNYRVANNRATGLGGVFFVWMDDSYVKIHSRQKE